MWKNRRMVHTPKTDCPDWIPSTTCATCRTTSTCGVYWRCFSEDAATAMGSSNLFSGNPVIGESLFGKVDGWLADMGAWKDGTGAWQPGGLGHRLWAIDPQTSVVNFGFYQGWAAMKVFGKEKKGRSRRRR